MMPAILPYPFWVIGGISELPATTIRQIEILDLPAKMRVTWNPVSAKYR
jgi:hypothetical protein